MPTDVVTCLHDGVDLDDYFTFGAGGPYRRNEVFTDREEYTRLLLVRTQDVATERLSTADLLDFGRPAHNVIVMHGQGGIGKTTLVNHFCAELTGSSSPYLPKRRVVASFDFADGSNLGFETVVLRVRAALGRLGRPFTAFDTGLSVYWELKHPGVSLTEFVGRSGFLSQEDREQTAQQIAGVVDELLGTVAVVEVGYKMASGLVRRLREAAAVRRIQREFPPFDLILKENDPDRMVGYLPILLAWDIERIRAKQPAVAVCHLDTFEAVQALPREKGLLEDLLARMVYLVPNVLFVVTSRRPLRWHDPVRAVTLTYGGGQRWPRLAGAHGVSDQYALAGLASGYADTFLRERLTVADGGPAIDEAVRRRIVDASAGSPLYLELSVSQYRSAALRGQPPDPAQFGGPLPELVLRIMRDLSAAERNLLRAAALLAAFDADILHAVLPDVAMATIRRFLTNSFVRHAAGTWPEYRIHQTLRQSINACDEYTDDGWVGAERAERAARAIARVTEIGLAIWRPDDGDTVVSAQRSQSAVAAMLLVLQAAVEHELLPDGLGELTYTLSQLGHWQVLAALPPADGAAPALRRLVEAARLASTAEVDARPRFQRLKALAQMPWEHPYDAYVAYELGSLTQSTGHHAEGDAFFASLEQAGPLLRRAGAWGRAGVALRRSRLADVLAYASPSAGQALDDARTWDLLGHVHLHGGDFARSAELFRRTLDQARAAGAPLWGARAARHLALATMWFDPELAVATLPEARELNQSLGDLIGLAQCDLAAAVAAVGRGDGEQADELLVRAYRLTEESGVVGQLLPVDAIAVLAALATDRPEQARRAAAALAADARADQLAPPVWAAVAGLWLGDDELYDFAAIGWYDSAELARERWMKPLHMLRPGRRSTAAGEWAAGE
jgi:tetratricopeptide (TPR) repeat protein